MSGLESIALAVAHLEEMSKAQEPSNDDSKLPSRLSSNGAAQAIAQTAQDYAAVHTNTHNPALVRASPSSTMNMPALSSIQTMPRPYPFVAAQTSRVVSSESISSTLTGGDDENDSHRPTTKKNNNNTLVPIAAASRQSLRNLAVVLTDPEAWLEATSLKPIPAPPSGVFEKVEEDDVLCGRGGESNHHPGNQQYRKLVKAFQPLYIASKRRYKPRIAQCIVYTIRSYGGRFLKRTGGHNNAFEDVGNTKAREKTSQALREGAPELRGPVGLQPVGVDSLAVMASSSSALEGITDNKVAPSAAAAASGGALPSNYINHPHHPNHRHHHHNFLQAAQQQQQLGPFNTNAAAAFGFHPSFAATLTPLQQALLMANHRSAAPAPVLPHPAAAAAPTTVTLPLPAMVGAAAPAPVGTTEEAPASTSAADSVVSESSKKRSLHLVSSGEDTSISSTSSSMSTTTDAGPTMTTSRGPRLKRFKHRLSKVNSEDDEEEEQPQLPSQGAVETTAGHNQ
jgi:hypothetical protein